jgi:hypothetical protein
MTFLYRRFYNWLHVPEAAADAQIHLLNPNELKTINRLEWFAMFVSGAIGTLAVLFLYLPQYQFPQLFPNHELTLPIVGKIAVPIVGTVYGIVLVFLEIWALTLLHIYCIHHVAVATGYITSENKQLAEKQKKILAVSTEQKDKTLLKFGINPYQGLQMSQVWLFNLFIALKATLSNMIVKILVRRFLGRYAVREVLDLLGIPIFAFWNIVATRTVLREARVMIMGQNLIDSFAPFFEKTALKIKDLPDAKTLIYDTLQFVAVSKRDYHANHAYLTAKILPIFDIPIENQHLIPTDYAQRLENADANIQRFCQFIIILGLLLDGHVSHRERKRIDKLHKEGILEPTVSELVALKNDFVEGRSIEHLTNNFLGLKLIFN